MQKVDTSHITIKLIKLQIGHIQRGGKMLRRTAGDNRIYYQHHVLYYFGNYVVPANIDHHIINVKKNKLKYAKKNE